MKLDLKDEMVKPIKINDLTDHWAMQRAKAFEYVCENRVREWQKTLDANKSQRNKDFLDEYGKQVDWDKVEGKELEERKEFHRRQKQ